MNHMDIRTNSHNMFQFMCIYIIIFIMLHLLTKYYRCVKLITEYVQDKIMDNVSSDEET